jgi:kynurenine formamidase
LQLNTLPGHVPLAVELSAPARDNKSQRRTRRSASDHFWFRLGCNQETMRYRALIIGYSLAGVLLLLAHRAPRIQASGFSRMVDLTQAVDISATLPEKHLTTLAAGPGTTIEAPSKLVPGLWTVHQIPSERLRAPLVVMNIARQVAADPGYRIGIEDIARWEQTHGSIPLGSVVVVQTGWKSPKAGAAVPSRFSEDATRFLVEGRVVLGLGSDQPAPQRELRDSTRTYAARHSLYQLDSLANLASVPEAGSWVVVAPVLPQDGSGSPARILALVR